MQSGPDKKRVPAVNLAVTLELTGNLLKPGFKVLLWRLASEAGLSGWAADVPPAVHLHLEGDEEAIRKFLRPLPGTLYPAYRLRGLRVLAREDARAESAVRKPFKILSGADSLPVIPPNRAPCRACLAEMRDPASRRYGYPFRSCPDCGPGYSALIRNPFVRANTFMAAFPPCRACREESATPDPARKIREGLPACPDCGPRLFLLDPEGAPLGDSHCIHEARKLLKSGGILAVQPLSGDFRLFADASNADAVRKIRLRKKIPARPFALMVRDLEAVRRICRCSEAEERLLSSPAAPVVILSLREDAGDLLPADLLCPDGPFLGVSLPSSLLTHLLFEPVPETPADKPALPFEYLVTACGNRGKTASLEPGIDELVYSLKGVADLFLCHDLKSGPGCPVSIAVVRDGAPRLWRRSRGFVPEGIPMKKALRRNAAAFGADQNAAVALAAGNQIIPSQYLGSVIRADDAKRLGAALEHFSILFDTAPDVAVCDMNPHLLSSAEALRFSEKYAVPLVTVQTHHALALACMAEHHLEHALAIVFDNGSPGPDGVYWGAELLDSSVSSIRRLGTFQAVSLPGRENALKRPVRQLAGRMLQAGVELTPDLLASLGISAEEGEIWKRNCSGEGRFLLTHAAARLFDAVSAGLGVAPEFVSYRNQSAARLEYAALRAAGGLERVPGWMYDKFEFQTSEDDSRKLVVDWTPLFRNFSDRSWITSENIPQLALAFHAKVADAVSVMAHYGVSRGGPKDIVLSGAMFMDGTLLNLVLGKLRSEKFRVYIPAQIPMNESALCVGQCYHAAF